MKRTILVCVSKQRRYDTTALVWMNERDNMCFCVDGFLSGDELLRVAESIVAVQ